MTGDPHHLCEKVLDEQFMFVGKHQCDDSMEIKRRFAIARNAVMSLIAGFRTRARYVCEVLRR